MGTFWLVLAICFSWLEFVLIVDLNISMTNVPPTGLLDQSDQGTSSEMLREYYPTRGQQNNSQPTAGILVAPREKLLDFDSTLSDRQFLKDRRLTRKQDFSSSQQALEQLTPHVKTLVAKERATRDELREPKLLNYISNLIL